MRKTEEELRAAYPWKSYVFDNIGAVMYGDIPLNVIMKNGINQLLK